jgi:aldehyde dehydrogenase (NAD+)
LLGSLEQTLLEQTNEMERVFNLQKKNQWKMKATTVKERIELLNKLVDSLERYRKEIDNAVHQDLGRPINSGVFPSEVDMILEEINYTVKHLEEWMTPEYHLSSNIPGAQYYVKYEPRGVCLLFGAWNVPFVLLFSPLIPMIAAGNCVIAKPNELASASSQVIAQIIRDTFDESVVAVFEGGIDVAEALQQLKFDHVFLTGSPNVGRSVMGAAAKHLSSVTLELGGRNPLILDETADLKSIAQSIGFSKTYNTGQVCGSINYVFVPAAKQDELIAEIINFYQENFYENGDFQQERVGRIVNGRNFDRVMSYVTDAKDKGAKIAFGGSHDRNKLMIEPTILVDVPFDSKIMENEVFGPVLPIVTYEKPTDIIDFVNTGGKPLYMFIFSMNDQFIDQIVNNTSSGNVTINNWALNNFENELPFGGVNESGIGSYHGIHGFKELSNARAVLKL